MVALAERLRTPGIPIREVTCGSTPTAVFGRGRFRRDRSARRDLRLRRPDHGRHRAIARDDISLTS